MDSEELKLSKWAIRIRPTLTMPWEEFPAQKFVAAQLLSMVESQGVQRFVLRSDAEEAGHTLLVSPSTRFRTQASARSTWIGVDL